MEVQCPLCGSTHQKLIEILKVSDIVSLYKKVVGKDFLYLFKGKNIEYYECFDCSLLHFSPIVTGDEAFYNRLQQFSWYYLDDKEEYRIAGRFLTNNIKTDISVLEVGSGKGAFKRYLKEADRYVGLEFSKEAIRLAKKNNIMLHAEMIEEHSIKYPNSYDVVCSFQVLEHAANPRSFIESCLLALKPKGILIIAVPHEDGFLKEEVNSLYNMPPHHVTRYSDKTLKDIAQIFNLELLSIEHEPFSADHLFPATYSTFQRKFLKPKILELSLKRTLLKFILKYICRGYLKIFKTRSKKINFKNGITTVAYYRKSE